MKLRSMTETELYEIETLINKLLPNLVPETAAAIRTLLSQVATLTTEVARKQDWIDEFNRTLGVRTAERDAERDVARHAIGEDDALDAFGYLTLLRGAGWRVAVHNDYRQHGQDWTFWLLTHPDGRWVKGEGVSDALALDQARRAALCPQSFKEETEIEKDS